MRIPLAIVATDLLNRRIGSFHRRRNRPGPARLLRLSGTFSPGRISQSFSGGRILDGASSRARSARTGRRIRDFRAPRAGPARFAAAQHHRSDQPLVFHHSIRRQSTLARRQRRLDRARRPSHPLGRIRKIPATDSRRRSRRRRSHAPHQIPPATRPQPSRRGNSEPFRASE